MEDRIIYPNPESSDGIGVIIIIPSGQIPTSEVARKDVPAGLPYFITTHDQLPEYWTQEAWEVDWTNPDGYGIGSDAWFAEQEAKSKEEK